MKRLRFFIAVCEEHGAEIHRRLPSSRIEDHLQLKYVDQLKHATRVMGQPVIRFFNVSFDGPLRPVGKLLDYLWDLPLPISKSRGKNLRLGEVICLFMDYAVASHNTYHN